ncbi:RNase adapter RapZ [Streptomyces anulatus]|uniref:RapZ C-terminal domain-containing protein n=1 Tax=Streptomyces anulatus TaxID=1892 RepID=UPI003445FE91
MTDVTIVSFGYLHGAPPPAHITLDLRHHFRDPHVSPELRYMTAADELVQQAVLGTPGVTDLVAAVADAVAAFAYGPRAGPVTVADGCAGGRHRAPVFAQALADQLTAAGHTVAVQHRDLHRPVVNR